MGTVLNTIGHAVVLSDGRQVLPGEIAEDIDVESDQYNASMVDDGTLLVVASASKSKSQRSSVAATENGESQ